jgi:prepilin-type N-terminal cleavage/methylation domain-containing protein
MAMKNAYGYTLLELAIVLMILALLVGGILKWQELDDTQAPVSTSSQV